MKKMRYITVFVVISVLLISSITANIILWPKPTIPFSFSTYIRPNNGDWHHIAITENNGDKSIYFDGILIFGVSHEQ